MKDVTFSELSDVHPLITKDLCAKVFSGVNWGNFDENAFAQEQVDKAFEGYVMHEFIRLKRLGGQDCVVVSEGMLYDDRVVKATQIPRYGAIAADFLYGNEVGGSIKLMSQVSFSKPKYLDLSVRVRFWSSSSRADVYVQDERLKLECIKESDYYFLYRSEPILIKGQNLEIGTDAISVLPPLKNLEIKNKREGMFENTKIPPSYCGRNRALGNVLENMKAFTKSYECGQDGSNFKGEGSINFEYTIKTNLKAFIKDHEEMFRRAAVMKAALKILETILYNPNTYVQADIINAQRGELLYWLKDKENGLIADIRRELKSIDLPTTGLEKYLLSRNVKGVNYTLC